MRLETGVIELELSNRVQPEKKEEAGVSGKQKASDRLKVFVKMQLDVNLALGVLLKNQLFEEAEPEFQHLASFATRISLRNALQVRLHPVVHGFYHSGEFVPTLTALRRSEVEIT